MYGVGCVDEEVFGVNTCARHPHGHIQRRRLHPLLCARLPWPGGHTCSSSHSVMGACPRPRCRSPARSSAREMAPSPARAQQGAGDPEHACSKAAAGADGAGRCVPAAPAWHNCKGRVSPKDVATASPEPRSPSVSKLSNRSRNPDSWSRLRCLAATMAAACGGRVAGRQAQRWSSTHAAGELHAAALRREAALSSRQGAAAPLPSAAWWRAKTRAGGGSHPAACLEPRHACNIQTQAARTACQSCVVPRAPVSSPHDVAAARAGQACLH